MRLVSTQNGVPTAEDIRAVIKAGIPGTSMVPLDQLSQRELDLLVDVVLQMRRDGVREQYVAQLKADDEEPVEADVHEVVQLRTTPGEVAAVPALGAADKQLLAAGQQLYMQQACASCHGDTGTGDQTMPLFDTAGRPISRATSCTMSSKAGTVRSRSIDAFCSACPALRIRPTST